MSENLNSGTDKRGDATASGVEGGPVYERAALPEFDEFLAGIGYGHLYRQQPDVEEDGVLPERPPAPQPAPVAPPEATGTAAPWRVWDRVTATLAAAAVAVAVGWSTAREILAEDAPAGAAVAVTETCTTSPDFTLDRFRGLCLGTSAGEVRDTLGLPLSRWAGGRAAACEEYWVYTVPRQDSDNSVPFCTVTVKSGVVAGVEEAPPLQASGPKLPAWPCPVRFVGNLEVALAQGRAHTLRTSDAGPTVLAGPHCSLDLKSAPLSAACVLHVSTPADASKRRAPLLPELAVYNRGTLYTLPHTGPGVSQESLREDLEWLLARLASR